jgi:hypothetical protein
MSDVQYCAVWFDASENEHRTGFVPTRDLAIRVAELIVKGNPSVRPIGPMVTIGGI